MNKYKEEGKHLKFRRGALQVLLPVALEDSQFLRVPLCSLSFPASLSLSPFFFFPRSLALNRDPGEQKQASVHSSPPQTAAERVKLPLFNEAPLSLADPPGHSPSVTFLRRGWWWLGWSEKEARGRGRRERSSRGERQEDAFLLTAWRGGRADVL